MELNWSTFLLEIFNFLVLVWILKHFLYHPILTVLENRRKKIQQSLSEASQRQTQAIALEQQYQGRLDQWELEKQQARDALVQEIQTERNHRLQQLQTELDNEREKASVIQERQFRETQQQQQQLAHQQAAKFAARLLSSLAGPDLELRLIDLFINELDQQTEERITRIRDSYTDSAENITVTSAYPLSDAQKKQLNKALSRLCGQPVTITYNQNSELIAGLHVTIDAWVLHINLRDELNSFVELSHDTLIS